MFFLFCHTGKVFNYDMICRWCPGYVMYSCYDVSFILHLSEIDISHINLPKCNVCKKHLGGLLYISFNTHRPVFPHISSPREPVLTVMFSTLQITGKNIKYQRLLQSFVSRIHTATETVPSQNQDVCGFIFTLSSQGMQKI